MELAMKALLWNLFGALLFLGIVWLVRRFLVARYPQKQELIHYLSCVCSLSLIFPSLTTILGGLMDEFL